MDKALADFMEALRSGTIDGTQCQVFHDGYDLVVYDKDGTAVFSQTITPALFCQALGLPEVEAV